MDVHSTKKDRGPENGEVDEKLDHKEEYGKSDTGNEYGDPNPE